MEGEGENDNDFREYDHITGNNPQRRNYGTFPQENNGNDLQDYDFIAGNDPLRRNYGTFQQENVWHQQLPAHHQVNELRIRRLREGENLGDEDLELYNAGQRPQDRKAARLQTRWQRTPVNENTMLGENTDPSSSHFRVSPWTENISDQFEDRIIPQWFYGNNTLNLPDKDFSLLSDFGYTFGAQLAKGAFGSVVDCRYTPENGDVLDLVCKYFRIERKPPQGFPNKTRQQMFETEKVAMLAAKHVNVIDVQNIWTNFESFYAPNPSYVLFFMEKADGDLFDYINHCFTTNPQPLDEYYLREWFIQILTGLEYLHSISIAHRDLKPENVLYIRRPAPFPYVAKLCDFGMAHIAAPNNPQSIMSTDRYGTANYMAPEVLTNLLNDTNIPYNPFVADIFSLGITLWWMSTANGHFAWNNFSPHMQDLCLNRMASNNMLQRWPPVAIRNHPWMHLQLIP